MPLLRKARAPRTRVAVQVAVALVVGPLCALVPRALLAQDPLRELESRLTAVAEAGRLSGAVLVARDSVVLLGRGFGLADRTRGTPNTVETRFQVGSMNKMFTAVAVAQLAHEGRLSFDDPIARFLPDFLPPQDGARVRIKHLLSHTSGLGHYWGPRFFRERPQTVAATLAIARESATLAFEPGTRWQYSNTGYLLLGAIIEQVSGMSYYEYVHKRIFEPAGMRHTDFPVADGALAVSYAPRRGGGPGEFEPIDHPRGGPAGGGASTVGDFLKFAEALRRGRLLPLPWVDVLLAPKPELSSPHYGFGFAIASVDPLIVGHNGGVPGAYGNLDIFWKSGVVSVVLLNQGDGTPQREAERLVREFVPRLGPEGGRRQ